MYSTILVKRAAGAVTGRPRCSRPCWISNSGAPCARHDVGIRHRIRCRIRPARPGRPNARALGERFVAAIQAQRDAPASRRLARSRRSRRRSMWCHTTRQNGPACDAAARKLGNGSPRRSLGLWAHGCAGLAAFEDLKLCLALASDSYRTPSILIMRPGRERHSFRAPWAPVPG